MFAGPIAQNTAIVNTRGSGVQSDSIALTGTLAANTTYTIFVQAGDATTDGNNFGFAAIDIHGEILTAVPEPGSLAVLGLFGLAGACRRRRA